MATVVDNGPPLKLKAESGDSLCLLAIEAGFEHCQRLRDANAGKDFVTSRHFEPGDYRILARAADCNGHVQPQVGARNQTHSVSLRVRSCG